MTFALIRGIKYLEAFFVPCQEYSGGFFEQLLVGGFFLGIFTYVAVIALSLRVASWPMKQAGMGIFFTDMAVEAFYLSTKRVPQYQTTCDPHPYDIPSHGVATCTFTMVYFVAYGAWTRSNGRFSAVWHVSLLMGNVMGCVLGEMLLEVRNPREIMLGAFIGMVCGGLAIVSLGIIAVFKETSCVKGFGWFICVEDTRIVDYDRLDGIILADDVAFSTDEQPREDPRLAEFVIKIKGALAEECVAEQHEARIQSEAAARRKLFAT